MSPRIARAMIALGLTSAVAACGTPPVPSSAPASSGAPAASHPAGPAQSTETPSPTPTPDQTALEPGTNHNRAADAYVHHAADVQAWLKDGAKAPGYPQHKIAFLTFDDGPNTTMTPKDLDALKQAGVHATFYYITKQLGPKTNPIAQRAIAEGNAIDVHSWSHDYNYLYPGRSGSAEHITADYDKAEKALQAALGPDYINHGFRYPGGHMSWKNLGPADQALAAKGVSWIDWNSMTGDAEPPKTHPTTAEGMVQMVNSNLKADASRNPNVAVILMHDAEDKAMTHEALPGLIASLRQQGYEFGVID